MTHDEYTQHMRDGRVKAHPLENLGISTEGAQESDSRPPVGYELNDFLPLLVQLLSPKQHLATAPDFTPRDFLEQIQLFDDGVDRRLYLFVNGTWSYCALT
jgi:hypothetical protein